MPGSPSETQSSTESILSQSSGCGVWSHGLTAGSAHACCLLLHLLLPLLLLLLLLLPAAAWLLPGCCLAAARWLPLGALAGWIVAG
jgi:hypothetical protein